ncbi:hypothetical protein POTOM_013240 [Populus tomentosa]|uniref:Uncharacterized protein n=1 Tax=Populus tomentosa TaxID=118781 RepID=A0A8X8AG05_POPTO|nr:hypothetical protein POTOM_013240 [Populus tomentosa]
MLSLLECQLLFATHYGPDPENGIYFPSPNPFSMVVRCHLMFPHCNCSNHSRHHRLRWLLGILVTQINIVVRSKNDNMKAHASFSNFNLELFFDRIRIAVLSTAAPYEVRKNSSVDFNYDYTSDPIPLNPEQMDDVDAYLKEDKVRFDLEGGVKARWKVGVLGSVGFLCHLNCQLHFHPSNGSYISRRCTSRA